MAGERVGACGWRSVESSHRKMPCACACKQYCLIHYNRRACLEQKAPYNTRPCACTRRFAHARTHEREPAGLIELPLQPLAAWLRRGMLPRLPVRPRRPCNLWPRGRGAACCLTYQYVVDGPAASGRVAEARHAALPTRYQYVIGGHAASGRVAEAWHAALPTRTLWRPCSLPNGCSTVFGTLPLW